MECVEGARDRLEVDRDETIGRLASLTGDYDAAMERLDTATYGTCERCGGAISEDRLGARPSARTCIQCASAR